MGRDAIRHALTIVAVIAAGFFFFFGAQSPAPLTGDGGEYVAMYYAWTETGRPYMTAPAWLAFDRFLDGVGLRAWALNNPFLHLPALQSGGTGDFNHFGFYSGLAAIVGIVLGLFDITAPGYAFLALHAVLLGIPAVLAWRHFRMPGLVAAAALTLLSPVVWLVDKVHTETFTHALALTAVILFVARRRLWAAVALGAAATQNPSFGAVAAAVVVIDFFLRKPRRYRIGEIVMIGIAGLLTCLHPLYYLARFGHITPQAMTHGIAARSDVSTVFVWFLDPDIGLLPNWPMGLAIIALASLSRLMRRDATRASETNGWWAFVACYLLFCLLAQSRTTNMNSGATVHVARYAMWYVPLFFPALLALLQHATRSVGYAIAVGVTLAASAVLAFFTFAPSISEPIPFEPSDASRYVQTRWPGWYDPPAEIFAERYGGIGESPRLGIAIAVIGPDCRKVLVFDRPERDFIPARRHCGFGTSRLLGIVRQRASAMRSGAVVGGLQDGTAMVTDPPTRDAPTQIRSVPYRASYVRLSDAEAEAITFRLRPDTWMSVAQAGDATDALTAWWHSPESWGAWSSGANALIVLPCANAPVRGVLQLELRRPPQDDAPSVRLLVRAGDAAAVPQELTVQPGATQIVDVPFDRSACDAGRMRVVINAPRTTTEPSPDASSPDRSVGIGLARLRMTGAP